MRQLACTWKILSGRRSKLFLFLHLRSFSTCKHPVIALVATKIQRKRGKEGKRKREKRNRKRKREKEEKIISEVSKFIKERVKKNYRVHLYSNVIEIPVISDTIEDRDMGSLAKLKHLLGNLGTHFNEKRGVLVPLNWEDYSMFLS